MQLYDYSLGCCFLLRCSTTVPESLQDKMIIKAKGGGVLNSQNNTRKENKVERLILDDFKTYYKDMGIQTMWYWQKDRHIEQWSRIESQEINLYIMAN